MLEAIPDVTLHPRYNPIKVNSDPPQDPELEDIIVERPSEEVHHAAFEVSIRTD